MNINIITELQLNFSSYLQNKETMGLTVHSVLAGWKVNIAIANNWKEQIWQACNPMDELVISISVGEKLLVNNDVI